MNNTIKEFLQNWKLNATNFYENERKSWLEEKKVVDEATQEFCNKYNGYEFPYQYFGYLNPVTFKDETKMNDYMKAFDMFYHLNIECTPLFKKDGKVNPDTRDDFFERYLSEYLDKEVTKKYKTLIKKIEKVVGTIEDASDLHLVKGEINGTIKGDKCTAKLNTILAGGYNIQCLHYRVLVKKLK